MLLGTNCFGWWPSDGYCGGSSTDCSSGMNWSVCSPQHSGTQVQLDVSGVAEYSCGSCSASFNKTFILDKDVTTPQYCCYFYTSSLGCTSPGVGFCWFDSTLGTAAVHFFSASFAFGPVMDKKPTTYPVDCTAAISMNELFRDGRGGTTVSCDFNSASMTVTPL